MKQKMCITVQGKTGQFVFNFIGDDKYVQNWRDEGLDIDVIAYSIPKWVVDLGLIQVWVKATDIWRWMRLF